MQLHLFFHLLIKSIYRYTINIIRTLQCTQQFITNKVNQLNINSKNLIIAFKIYKNKRSFIDYINHNIFVNRQY